MEIEIRRGDITDQSDLDAIVNAANTDLVLGSGVAGAIRRKGGENISREAVAQAPIRLGEAVATSAGQLPHKYVIHAAAMGYREEDQVVPKRSGSLSSADIIRNATRNSLRIAEHLRLGSIAFPALATGVAGFPVAECAEVMIGDRARVRQRPFRQLNSAGGVRLVERGGLSGLPQPAGEALTGLWGADSIALRTVEKSPARITPAAHSERSEEAAFAAHSTALVRHNGGRASPR